MKKKAQIWIETVLYTLIGIVLVGVVLAFATPRINEARDRALVQQSIEALKIIDGKFVELIDSGSGNRRSISNFMMKRGELYINATSDEILFLIDGLNKPYSEPGFEIREGKVYIKSESVQKSFRVSLVLRYSDIINLTYGGSDQNKKFTPVSVSYSFNLENLGGVPKPQIDIIETTRR